jgi:hypothetical protein
MSDDTLGAEMAITTRVVLSRLASDPQLISCCEYVATVDGNPPVEIYVTATRAIDEGKS